MELQSAIEMLFEQTLIRTVVPHGNRDFFKFVYTNAMCRRLTRYVTPSIALAKSPVLVLYLNNVVYAASFFIHYLIQAKA